MKSISISLLGAVMIMSATAHSSFISDDKTLDIHLRNYYKNDKVKTSNAQDTSQTQWSQSINVNFSSEFYSGLAGFDLGGYYSLKLLGRDYDNTGLLPIKGDGDSYSYGKTSYAIKFNLNDMGVAKYGRMFIETPLLHDSDSRSLPSLTEGFYAKGAFNSLSIYTILATKNNSKSDSAFDSMMVNGQKERVKVVGGSYDFGDNLSTHVAIGQQNNYARRTYVKLNYEKLLDIKEVSINTDLSYTKNNRIGVSKQANQDNSQKTWGANLGASVQHASFGVSYQNINQTDIGAFDSSWSIGENGDSDSTGYLGPNSLMISDFNANGQKSWGFNVNYNFAGIIAGLDLSAVYVKGAQDPKGDNNNIDEKEYNLMASYDMPQIDGLNLSAQYGKNTQKQPVGTKVHTKEIRLIVKYDMSVF